MSDKALIERLTQLAATAHLSYRIGWQKQARQFLQEAADTIARLTAERDAARADARLAAYVRGRAEPAPDGWRIDVWISGAPSIETIDEALSVAMREGEGK